ncbi:tyrosine-protein phosphatase [Micromonospora sp. DT227]|uniref:tyrosine-protein phosphatase n=1 Tax=Micromonospora sp. DT227 TaxID=3393433 RepID=UPI003CF75FF1
MTAPLEFSTLCNFRDLGGWRTDNGRTVARGRLYRSDSLAKLAGDDLARFAALGVRTVIDLRYPWEIADRGRAPESLGVTWHNLSIEHRTYVQADIDPDVDPWRYLADRYAEVAEDGVVELRRAVEVITSRAPNTPPGGWSPSIAALRARLLTDDEKPHDGDATLWQARSSWTIAGTACGPRYAPRSTTS